MASLLGKRKRRSPPQEFRRNEETHGLDLNYQNVLKKHFEASFQPVGETKPINGNTSKSAAEDVSDLAPLEHDSSDSDWSGFSENEEVEIISHETAGGFQDDEVTAKSQRKQFMSSKPPTLDATSGVKTKSRTKPSAPGDAKSAASFTAEDLALQRLLSESHLLSGSTSSTLLPSLKARQQAQDLRLQGLGAKRSVDALGAGNMPMAIRKGIANKKQTRERDRRREAKEAGIVLERETKSVDPKRMRRRPADVGAPAVGKWKGGTLVLGKKDVAEIESQRLASDFGKRERGSKRGRGKRR